MDRNKKSEFIIETRDLTKKFGSFLAVDRVNLKIEKGQIIGLLGANGAGKSTLIRMLCGLLKPSLGEAKVAGYDLSKNTEQIRLKLGYMSQKFSLYPDLTVFENLKFFSGIYGLSRPKSKERIDEIITLLGLTDSLQKISRELACGYRQRLALGCALLHQPPLVFLDEPTGGVDPLGRKDFWRIIQNLSTTGTTLLVSTHYLDEAEYCHEIFLMNKGKIIAQGKPGQLKAEKLKGKMYELTCLNNLQVLELLKNFAPVKDCSLFGTKLHVLLDQSFKVEELINLLAKKNWQVTCREILPSLEDVFLFLTKHEQEATCAN